MWGMARNFVFVKAEMTLRQVFRLYISDYNQISITKHGIAEGWMSINKSIHSEKILSQAAVNLLYRRCALV